MANDVPDTTKSEIALLLKKAAPVFGIDGTAYHVLDILLGLSRAEDWKGAGRPVVAISNAKLAEYTMRSERTVIRCIRRLVEAGIAAYRDSSTGRRFVYRNDDGEMLAGYGIDFTPARVRVEEIRSAVERYQKRLAIELSARRDIARLSRAIEDLIIAYPSGADDTRAELAALAALSDSIEVRAAKICALYERLLVEFANPPVSSNLSREGDIDGAPYINTTQEPSFESRNKQTRSNERDIKSSDDRYAVEKAFEKKPAKTDGLEQGRIGERIRDADTIQGEVLGSVSIGLLQAACAEAQSITAMQFDSWGSLVQSGEVLRRMIGLSEAGWSDGKTKVGPHAACAILATVVEKAARDPEQISRPGGYFRAMIERAVDGKLNLERSLFGLADGRYGIVEK